MAVAIKARELNSEESKRILSAHFLEEEMVVWTLLRSVSKSGMSRQISVFVVDQHRHIWDVTYHTGSVLGMSVHETNGARSLKVDGCGMDMGFHLVYNLSSVLFNDGYSLKQRWL
jgi:hypothetical protein